MSRYDPRADPIRLAKRESVRPTTAVEPGEWAVVDGVIDGTVAHHHAGAVLPSPTSLAPDEPDPPLPSGAPPVEREPDWPDHAAEPSEALGDDVVDPAVLGYAVETVRPTTGPTGPFQWRRVHQGVESVPFRVRDDHGSVRVEPTGSKSVRTTDGLPRVSSAATGESPSDTDPGSGFVRHHQPYWYVDGGVGFGQSRYVFDTFPVTDGTAAGDPPRPELQAFLEAALERDPTPITLRYRERAVGDGDAVYVLGRVREVDGEPAIVPAEPEGTFLVSARRLGESAQD